MRIVRFQTRNDFNDWDTALHTFTFANAVEQGLRRSPSPSCCAACSTPRRASTSTASSTSRPLPQPNGRRGRPDDLLDELPRLLDRQQQVDEAGRLRGLVPRQRWRTPPRFVAALGAALVREDRNFHTIQCIEAAARQHELLAGTEEGLLPLLAAARYLAAHATTTRSQRQTFDIARRLYRGERLYEE